MTSKEDLGIYSSFEQDILDYLEDLGSRTSAIPRTAELIELEKEMHSRLTPWAKDHKKRYRHMGLLPYLPDIFENQKITVPGDEAAVLRHFIPNKYYAKFANYTFVKSVGSAAVADQIVKGFLETPAFLDEEDYSLTDYVSDAMDNGESVAVVSGHLDRLSDISDFTGGIMVASMNKSGTKYSGKFKVIVSKLMTRETMYMVPISSLMKVGLAPRWGLPELGATKWGVPAEATKLVNSLLAGTIISEQREKGQVVGIVPAGTAAIPHTDPESGEIIKLHLPHSSAIASLFPRYKAIIPVSRWGEKVAFGQVIEAERPKKMHIREYSHELTDQINYALALQASELAGVPVEFEKLRVGTAGAGVVAVKAVTDIN